MKLSFVFNGLLSLDTIRIPLRSKSLLLRDPHRQLDAFSVGSSDHSALSLRPAALVLETVLSLPEINFTHSYGDSSKARPLVLNRSAAAHRGAVR